MNEKYDIRCDTCKTTISTTNNIGESAQGGTCIKCKEQKRQTK